MQAYPPSALLGLAAATVALVAGVVLLRRGWLGRLVGDHPHCRACGFDLYGSPGAVRCPECGADLSPAASTTTVGARRARRGLLAAGLCLTLAGGGWLAMAGRDAANGVAWHRHLPTFMLRRQLAAADARTAVNAAAELLGRVQAGDLSRGQAEAVVEAVLAQQGQAGAPWDPTLGDLVELTRAQGLCPDAQWQRYAKQAAQVTLVTRPDARRGDELPYGLWAEPSKIGTGRYAPPDTEGWFYLWHRLAGIGTAGAATRPVVDDFVRIHGRSPTSRHRSWLGENRRAPLLPDVPTGKATLTLDFEFGVGWHGPRDREQPPQVTWRRSFDAAVNVVPAGEENVKLVTRADLADGVARSVAIIETQPEPGRPAQKAIVARGGGSIADLAFRGDRPPVHLAFDVFLRDASGREAPAGGIKLSAGTGRAVGASFGEAALSELRGPTLDVVLRPSRERARHTTDMGEIWGGSLEFRGVPVVWLRAPATNAAAGWPPATGEGAAGSGRVPDNNASFDRARPVPADASGDAR